MADPPAAQGGASLTSACTHAARQFFGDYEARAEMREDEPRVDGTQTAGGTIYLETRAASIRCGFPADQLRLTEFYVDGQDQLAALQGGRPAASGNVPNYDRPVGGVLPQGSDFTASSMIPCSRPGTGSARCDAGVVREGGGSGFLVVVWPDAGSRVLYFENGEITGYDESEADGGAELRVTRNADVQIVAIGDARFEVVAAVPVGG